MKIRVLLGVRHLHLIYVEPAFSILFRAIRL